MEMRKLCLLLALTIGAAGCGSGAGWRTYHVPLSPLPAVQDHEAAELVVFRTNSVRAAILSFLIAIDGVDVFYMPNKSYKIFRLKAGEHVVTVRKAFDGAVTHNESVIRLSLTAGARRYLVLSPSSSRLVDIDEMTQLAGERQLKKYPSQ